MVPFAKVAVHIAGGVQQLCTMQSSSRGVASSQKQGGSWGEGTGRVTGAALGPEGVPAWDAWPLGKGDSGQALCA